MHKIFTVLFLGIAVIATIGCNNASVDNPELIAKYRKAFLLENEPSEAITIAALRDQYENKTRTGETEVVLVGNILSDNIGGLESAWSDGEATFVLTDMEQVKNIRSGNQSADDHSGHDHAATDQHDHDHSGHDHEDHDHKANDDTHKGHDHSDAEHKHSEEKAHDHSGHDHAATDQHDHDHSGHDHEDHDHKANDDTHKGHDHSDAEHKHSEEKAHDHSGHDHATTDQHDHDHSGHDHSGHDHAAHAHDHSNCLFCQETAKKQKQEELKYCVQVEFVDSEKNKIAIDAKKLFNLQGNEKVIVKGKASVSKSNTLSVVASEIYIQK